MPLDTSIYRNLTPVEFPDMLETMARVEQFKGLRDQNEARRLAAQEAREKRERQVAIEHAKRAALKFDEKTGRISFDKQQLMANLPGDLAYQAQQELDEDEININKLATSVLEVEGKRRDYRGSISRTIRAAKYDPTMFRTLMRGAHGFGAIEGDVLARYEGLEDPTQIQTIVDDYIAQTGEDADVVAVKTVNAQGQEVTKFVRKEPGVEYPAAPAAADLITVHTVDERGRPVTKVVPKVAGGVYPSPPPAPSGTDLITVQTVDAHGRPVTRVVPKVAGAEFPNQPSGPPPVDARAITEASVALVDRLAKHPGIGAATGAYEWRGFTQDAVDFNAIREQLVAALTLPNLGALKGPMSDKDILFVKNLATRLGNTKLSEAETRTALAEARTFLQNKLDAAGGSGAPPSTVPDLTGLAKGRGRRFTEGPFAGQTWTLDDNGQPYRVK